MGSRPSVDPFYPLRPYVVVSVSNLERSMDFYIKAFNLSVFYCDPRLRFVELSAGPDKLHSLTLHELAPGEKVNPCRMCSTQVAWRTDDLTRERNAMIKLGIPVTPVEYMPGTRLFWVADTDDNQTAVVEFLPE